MSNRFRLLLAILLWIAAPLHAQSSEAAGTWAVEAGGRTLSLIELHRDPTTGGGWTGGWTRPDQLGLDSSQLVEAQGPVVRRRIRGGAPRGPAIELMIEGRSPDGPPDVFLFRPIDAGHAEIAWRDVPLPPLALVRAAPGSAVWDGWEAARRYPITTPRPTNAEMTAIFTADQADREAGPDIDWSVVTPRDLARRARTRALLEAGALRSGDDFYHAAFVFQHGDEPGDYLLAHSFAVIAAARGRPDATWIASATLDRYLQKIGQPQIYGTQYSSAPGRPTTQDPYDRALVSDAIRALLGVPDQPAQARQRAAFEAR